MNTEQERADFEWWASDEGENPRAVERVGECYKLAQIQSYWMAWQARAALKSQDREVERLAEALRDARRAQRDELAARLTAAQAANADALDAARYRLLRKGAVDDVAVVRGLGATDYGMSAVVYTYSEEIDGDDLDAAIDHARRIEGDGE